MSNDLLVCFFLPGGEEMTVQSDELLSAVLEQGVSGGTLPLGAAVSQRWELLLFNGDGRFQPNGPRLRGRSLTGAAAQVFSSGEAVGRFLVTETRRTPEGFQVCGYDEMAVSAQAVFEDDLTYPAALPQVLSAAAAQAGLTVEAFPDCNAAYTLQKRPSWGKSTVRAVIGFASAAMGAYAFVTPQGTLRLQPLRALPIDHIITPSRATSLILQTECFRLAAVRIISFNAENAAPVLLREGDGDTLTIEDNPLFFASAPLNTAANALLQTLKGFTLTPFEMQCVGDALPFGARVRLTDAFGGTADSTVFYRRLVWGETPSAFYSCSLDASGVSLPRVLTAAGTVTSAALSDGLVSARCLSAASVTAEKLAAEAVTADKLAAGAVTARSISAEGISADVIRSGTLDTDRLIVGGSEFSIVRAINQLAESLTEEQQNDTNTLSGHSLRAHTVTAEQLESGIGGTLDISANTALLMVAGKLDGTSSHMEITENAVNISGGEVNIFGEGALTLRTGAQDNCTINGGVLWHGKNMVLSTSQPPLPDPGMVWIRPNTLGTVTGTWTGEAFLERPRLYTCAVTLKGTPVAAAGAQKYRYNLRVPVYGVADGYARISAVLLPSEDAPISDGIRFPAQTFEGKGSHTYRPTVCFSSAEAPWLGEREELTLLISTDDRDVMRVDSGVTFSLSCTAEGEGSGAGWKPCDVFWYVGPAVRTVPLTLFARADTVPAVPQTAVYDLENERWVSGLENWHPSDPGGSGTLWCTSALISGSGEEPVTGWSVPEFVPVTECVFTFDQSQSEYHYGVGTNKAIPRGTLTEIALLHGTPAQASGGRYTYTLSLPLYWQSSSVAITTLYAVVSDGEHTLTFPTMARPAGRGSFRYEGTVTAADWLGHAESLHLSLYWRSEVTGNYLYAWHAGAADDNYRLASLTMTT